MKTFCLILLLVIACVRREQATTATIEPAEPQPARTLTSTMEDLRVVTTSGSPPPAELMAAGSEVIAVGNGSISVRPLLPRGHTAFRITNADATPHDLEIRSASGTASVAVAAREAPVLQIVLSDARYEIRCATPGHAERAEFATYVAGAPLTRPGGTTAPR